MLAMVPRTPRGARLPALSLTTIASKLAPTGGSALRSERCRALEAQAFTGLRMSEAEHARVHMLSIGHPLLGDGLYAHEQALVAWPRLCLHASMLTFTHPQTSERLRFECPAPF